MLSDNFSAKQLLTRKQKVVCIIFNSKRNKSLNQTYLLEGRIKYWRMKKVGGYILSSSLMYIHGSLWYLCVGYQLHKAGGPWKLMSWGLTTAISVQSRVLFELDSCPSIKEVVFYSNLTLFTLIKKLFHQSFISFRRGLKGNQCPFQSNLHKNW